MFTAELYLPIYHHIMLLVVLVAAAIYLRGEVGQGASRTFNAGMLPFGAAAIILFLGTRPISGAFVDMTTYAASYARAAANGASSYPDPGFDFLLRGCAKTIPVEWFFFLCSILYIVPLAIAMRKAHDEWAFAVFLALTTSFSFFAYGTNGIRNGIACSIMICAFAYRANFLGMSMLMVAAASMHKSVILPAAAFLVARYITSVALYAGIWMFTFVLVTIRGEAITALFSRFTAADEDERLSTYIASGGFSNDRGGYRLDFVLYGIIPIAITYALANARTRGDILYNRLVCTYLATNTVWLLLMHAAFSNRFAYLSWFFMPWVIIYPFVTAKPEEHKLQQSWAPPRYGLLAVALIAHYAFTYAMNIIILPARGG